MSNNQQLAQDFKNRHDVNGGYVVIYNKIAVSWMPELHDPRRQMPGCIAIDENGKQWITEGGNDAEGAQRWREIN